MVAGYLIWLRSRLQPVVTPQPSPEVTNQPTASPQASATPSATPGGKEATGSTKTKSATSPAMEK